MQFVEITFDMETWNVRPNSLISNIHTYTYIYTAASRNGTYIHIWENLIQKFTDERAKMRLSHSPIIQIKRNNGRRKRGKMRNIFDVCKIMPLVWMARMFVLRDLRSRSDGTYANLRTLTYIHTYVYTIDTWNVQATVCKNTHIQI